MGGEVNIVMKVTERLLVNLHTHAHSFCALYTAPLNMEHGYILTL